MSPFPGLLPPGNAALQPSLANLVIWLKTPIAGATDGNLVDTWPDSSGNSNDCTSPGAGMTYRSSGAGMINSIPTLESNITFTGYYVPPMDTSAWSAATIFIVQKSESDPPAQQNSGLWTWGQADFTTHYCWNDGVVYDGAFTTVRKTVGDLAQVLTSPHLYTVRSASGEWTAFINGSQVFTTATNTFNGTTTFNRIGEGYLGGTHYLYVGWAAEILVYDAAITGSAFTQTTNYLINRFGL